MYLLDLSPYPNKKEYSSLGTLSIGWLDRSYAYPQGEVEEKFRRRLLAFCLHPVILTRGFHRCNLCTPPTRISVHVDNREIYLGSAEIRVFYRDKVYAAPDLIYHYIVLHRYLPPEEFIEAVLAGPLPHTRQYEEFKRRKKIDWW